MVNTVKQPAAGADLPLQVTSIYFELQRETEKERERERERM